MPKDRKGNELREGDTVMIPAIVQKIEPTEEFINVVVETMEPIYPAKHRTPIVLNTKQVELLQTILVGAGDSITVSSIGGEVEIDVESTKDSDPCGNETEIIKRNQLPDKK